MDNQLDLEQLSRYLSGNATLEECREIEHRIQSDSEFAGDVEELRKIWSIPESNVESSDLNALWRTVTAHTGISESIESDRPSVRRLTWAPPLLKIASALVLVFTASCYFWFSWSGKQEFVTHLVSPGQQDTLLLADGSRVILDAGSSFRYPPDFTGLEREVHLTGEGYFKVEHSPQPFTVHAAQGRIEVLGTAFNVRAWGEYREVLVYVKSGTVRFGSDYDPAGTARVILHEDHFSTLAPSGAPAEPARAEPEDHLDWMSGIISFDNVPLREIRFHLERIYNTNLIFDDESLLQELFTIQIQRNSLEDTIHLISAMTGMDFVQEHGAVRFFSLE